MRRKKLGLAVMALAAGAVAPAAHADPVVTLGPTRLVAGPSPYNGCTDDRKGRQVGELFRNAEVEPWVAVNPADPANLIAGWQQDRWSNGGARGDAGAYSLDGGDSWIGTIPTGTALCNGGIFRRSSDPWISFSPDGTAHFNTLNFDTDKPNGLFGANELAVSRSTDGGRTWEAPVQVVFDPTGQALNDKNSLTADPNDSDIVYVVWDRLVDFTLPGSTAQIPSDGRPVNGTPLAGFAAQFQGDGVAMARERMKRAQAQEAEAASGTAAALAASRKIFFEGPTKLARSTDGGLTYEPARTIYDPGPNAQTLGNIVVGQPSGRIYNFFWQFKPRGATQIGFVASDDKGATWDSAPTIVANHLGIGTATPDLQDPVRDGDILFSVAVVPGSGDLVVAWQDSRFRGGVNSVAFTRSSDDGATWSKPIRIDRTPADGANPLRQQSSTPSIVALEDGTLVVTYYDFRNDTDGAFEGTDYWAIFCFPGKDCSVRENWTGERRLTSATFDIAQAPVARGYFLGDYQGLTASGDRAVAVWAVATQPGRNNIVSRVIEVGPSAVLAGD